MSDTFNTNGAMSPQTPKRTGANAVGYWAAVALVVGIVLLILALIVRGIIALFA